MDKFRRSVTGFGRLIPSSFALLLLLACTGPALGSAEDDFIAAREAFRTGNFTRLSQYAKRLDGHVLEPYAELYMLQMRLKDASAGEIREFLRQNADTPVAEKLRGDWLRQVGRQQDWALFTSEYKALAAPDTELQCYALQARQAAGDFEADNQAMRLWQTGSELPGSCTTVFDTMRAGGRLPDPAAWWRIRLALEAGNVSVAKSATRYLGSLEAAAVNGSVDKAVNNPQHFLDHLPVDLKTRAGREVTIFALYRLARTLPQQAEAYWNMVQSNFDEAERNYLWGQLALQAAKRLEPFALQWFRKTPPDQLTDSQLAWRVRMDLRAQDWKDVLASVDAMTPAEQGRGSWRYWKARALKAQGKTTEANAILAPLSRSYNYYGQLALEELGEVMASAPLPYKVTEDDVAAVRMIPGIQRAVALYRMDLRLDAVREWTWTIRGFDDRKLLAAAELARRMEWYDRSINTADKTMEVHDFSLRFPAPHREIMQGYTRQWQLDEAWVYGLIRQESRFVPAAKSTVGASGLMQIMPATARWVAKKLGASHFRQSLITRLDTNIEFGTYYLKHVLADLDGQPVLATAAYNAGPQRARRWRDPTAMEGAIYAESIPFTETREYVQKVMSNAHYYAQRFNHQMRSLKSRLGTIVGNGALASSDAPE